LEWQELKRKDTEQAFGVFQAQYGALAAPIKIHSFRKLEVLLSVA
jgi:hypothetical protein